jgi:hypothetical protein
MLTLTRPGSSGQTNLVAATSQTVRFARSLATRLDAGQALFTYMCFVRSSEWLGNARVLWSLARRTGEWLTGDVSLSRRFVAASGHRTTQPQGE